MLEAVIFDLDDTLLDTSALSRARREGQWSIVKTRLARVRPFASSGVAIEELPARLKADGLKIGVLTHSPAWYAKTLLDRFGIRADALITGSDGYPPKPDPTSLKAIAEELGVAIGDCVYVGDLDRAVRSLPGAIAQPPLVPVLVEALLDVGAVSVDFDGPSQCLECLADRGELHTVVRRAMRAARNLTDGPRLLDHCGRVDRLARAAALSAD